MIKRALLFAAMLTLAGCGGGMVGEYVPDGNSPSNPIAKLELKADGSMYVTGATSMTIGGMTVPVTENGGMTKKGSYKVADGRVTTEVDGQSAVFTIDGKNCLDAGGMVGKFCKH